ncbi:3-hydroxyisobutyrate dehydrogenase [Lentibacillus halodurans]|uniref:3-hydroxyisobutyrate dehydrogenase n=2 Tax=Lentibacillus halodurans TaxID=237679 RepID=A0A1I0XMG9_9BACI|nr:3-hydroxyisobutyrate dehydrogenase [Lentibacillus halodurans]
MKKAGIIGCGLMGSGIARNLLKHYDDVYVYDIDQRAVENLQKNGAIAVDRPDVLAEETDFLILSLPTPKLIEKTVMDKENGIIHVMKNGAFILDMSTNDVQMTRKLYHAAKSHGVDFFDCPLSGGPERAANGTLTIMVGGDDKSFPSILPVLQSVGDHIEYIGDIGSGQIVKLCHNMVVGGVITLLSEAFMTGEKAGVSKEKLASILQKGSAHTRAMDVFGTNILDHTFEDVKFSLANMSKDIQLYRSLTEQNQLPAFASHNVHHLFHLANDQGKGILDSSAIYQLLSELEEGAVKH